MIIIEYTGQSLYLVLKIPLRNITSQLKYMHVRPRNIEKQRYKKILNGVMGEVEYKCKNIYKIYEDTK